MQVVHENAVTFGKFNGLVGIVSERADAAPGRRSDLPAVLILNTGIIHRVGAGRLTTIWARRLATEGHCVLRFDLSGIGDSERRRDNLPPFEAALSDLRDALDWLVSARGIRRVVLIGLCASADLSLLYAGDDSRIVGMVIIDPSTPLTRRHYFLKLLRRDVWRRKLQALVNRTMIFRKQSSRTSQDVAGEAQYDEVAPPEDTSFRALFSTAYQSAFAREVKTLAIFTTGAEWYNYRNQLFDAFPEIDFSAHLQLEYFERCDHMITHEANRARLFQAVNSWLATAEFKSPSTAADTQQLPVVGGPRADDLISLEF
jgi:dienelactone hydrolase